MEINIYKKNSSILNETVTDKQPDKDLIQYVWKCTYRLKTTVDQWIRLNNNLKSISDEYNYIPT